MFIFTTFYGLTNTVNTRRDLSKQFWCPLYDTKNSVLQMSFETTQSYNWVLELNLTIEF